MNRAASNRDGPGDPADHPINYDTCSRCCSQAFLKVSRYEASERLWLLNPPSVQVVIDV